MMTAKRIDERLVDRLPAVRGSLAENEPLARYTWFRVGGPAEVLFQPADEADLAAFVAAKPADVPVTVIGVTSNLLIRDGGIPGVVLRLGRGFAGIDIVGTDVRAGAGALDIQVARACRDASVGGLEFLVGVPGTIGGALRMNAGAYGREINDVIRRARAISPAGRAEWLTPDRLGYTYRHSVLPEGWIFTAADLAGGRDSREAIAARMHDITSAREASQPLRTRTGGSTFTNPPGHKAWELIEAAGCRGLRQGAAMVSDKHCNFLVNTGEASATDIETLGEEVRRRVREMTGVTLEWEIRRVGVPALGGRG